MTLFPILAVAQAAAPASGNILSGIADTFKDIGLRMGVDGPRLLSQTVVFLLVAYCLKRFAFGPILKVLDQRQATIKESLANAEKIRQELADAEAKHHEIVRHANELSSHMIEDAKKAIEFQAQKRLKETAHEVEQMLANARQTTADERERMILDLRHELLHLVVDATAKATGKVLNADDQERLRREALSDVSLN